MGDIVLSIPVVRAPGDAEALASLHREVWSCVREVISFVTEQEANAEIVSSYLTFQADDGFDSGDWHATSTELSYSFGDAAGLCSCEMYAVWHWARLASLHYWPELTLIAEKYGAVLAPSLDSLPVFAAMAGRPTMEMYDDTVAQEMKAELTGRAGRVFFIHEGKLAYAETYESADDGHEIYLYGDERMSLGELPAAQRERVTELVRTGRCACEPCQRLREQRGLPLAPEPADAGA